MASIIYSCSGDKKNNVTVVELDETLAAFQGANAVNSIKTIDSLALEADFITEEQAVAVLMGLSEIAKAEEAKGSKGKKLEYMRKYVDTYDILTDRGQEFKDAIEDAKVNYHVDFAAINNQYRDVLNVEADGVSIEGEGDGGVTDAGTAAPAAPDSTRKAEEPATPAPAPADSVG